jgi:hypothetical protein
VSVEPRKALPRLAASIASARSYLIKRKIREGTHAMRKTHALALATVATYHDADGHPFALLVFLCTEQNGDLVKRS